MAISAYTPPITTPLTSCWKNSCMIASKARDERSGGGRLERTGHHRRSSALVLQGLAARDAVLDLAVVGRDLRDVRIVVGDRAHRRPLELERLHRLGDRRC